MKNIGTYQIDKNIILEKAYDLMCVFFADKEISRKSNPDDVQDPLKSLKNLFFYSKASRLLIELAVSLRVIDDQMRALPDEDQSKHEYFKAITEVDNFDFGLFDDINLTFRDTCNKIIHSDILEPHVSTGIESHEYDYNYQYGDSTKKTIDWDHLNGLVRLHGFGFGKEWYVLLDVEIFIKAIFRMFGK